MEAQRYIEKKFLVTRPSKCAVTIQIPELKDYFTLEILEI